jgi:hypothetical protein
MAYPCRACTAPARMSRCRNGLQCARRGDVSAACALSDAPVVLAFGLRRTTLQRCAWSRLFSIANPPAASVSAPVSRGKRASFPVLLRRRGGGNVGVRRVNARDGALQGPHRLRVYVTARVARRKQTRGFGCADVALCGGCGGVAADGGDQVVAESNLVEELQRADAGGELLCSIVIRKRDGDPARD